MKRLIVLFATLFSVSTMAAAKFEAGTYKFDPAHSTVEFSVVHMGVTSVTGKFKKIDGQVTLADKITASQVTATIDPASIDTANEKRDEHLRSADFFDVTNHPEMKFVSKKVTGTAKNLTVVGDLTLHGVTKEVTLKGQMNGPVKGMTGETRAGFTFTTTLKRKDFGLTWNKLVEGVSVVSDEVKVTLNIATTKEALPEKS